LARQAGLKVVPPVPALAGLFTRETWPGTLAGIVLERGAMRLGLKGHAGQWLTGPVLFTHKGLSGLPRWIYRARSRRGSPRYGAGRDRTRHPCARVVRGLADSGRWLKLFDGGGGAGGRALHNLLSGELPRALAHALCEQAGARELAVAREARGAARLGGGVRGDGVARHRDGGWGGRWRRAAVSR
jgi:hypothetical protein